MNMTGKYLSIWVSREEIEKIFEKYKQSGTKSLRGGGGTGLGLYIVKQIVEAHGGEVSVDLSASKAPLAIEWFNPRTGEKRAGDRVEGGAQRPFQAPFAGDAVLYLRKE